MFKLTLVKRKQELIFSCYIYLPRLISLIYSLCTDTCTVHISTYVPKIYVILTITYIELRCYGTCYFFSTYPRCSARDFLNDATNFHNIAKPVFLH